MNAENSQTDKCVPFLNRAKSISKTFYHYINCITHTFNTKRIKFKPSGLFHFQQDRHDCQGH